jgi:hypothetical protein
MQDITELKKHPDESLLIAEIEKINMQLLDMEPSSPEFILLLREMKNKINKMAD